MTETTLSAELDRLGLRVKAAVKSAAEAGQAAVEKAIAAGELLNEFKSKVEHGKWLPWLTDNQIVQRTAQRYMRLAAKRKELEAMLQSKSATMADLTIVGAEELLGPESSGENAGNNNNAAGNSADQSDNGGNNTTLTLGDKLDKKMNGIIKALDTIKKKEGIDTAIEETQKLQEQLDAKLAKLTKEKMQKDKEVKAAKPKAQAAEHASA